MKVDITKEDFASFEHVHKKKLQKLMNIVNTKVQNMKAVFQSMIF